MQRPRVDLPQPDSPTSPRVSPRASWSETPSTARSTSRLVRLRRSLALRPRAKLMCRSVTSSSGLGTCDHRLTTRIFGAVLVVETPRGAAAELDQRDRSLDTVRPHEPAARMEAAALRRRGKVGRRAGNGREVVADAVEAGHRPEQAERVRVVRLAEDGVDASGLHELARVHDRNPRAG